MRYQTESEKKEELLLYISNNIIKKAYPVIDLLDNGQWIYDKFNTKIFMTLNLKEITKKIKKKICGKEVLISIKEYIATYINIKSFQESSIIGETDVVIDYSISDLQDPKKLKKIIIKFEDSFREIREKAVQKKEQQQVQNEKTIKEIIFKIKKNLESDVQNFSIIVNGKKIKVEVENV